MEIVLTIATIIGIFYLYRINNSLRGISERYYLFFDRVSVEKEMQMIKILVDAHNQRDEEIDRLYGKQRGKRDDKEFEPNQEYRRKVYERMLINLSIEAARDNYALLIECNSRAFQGENIRDLYKMYDKRFKYHIGSLSSFYFSKIKWLETQVKKSFQDWEKDQTVGEPLKNLSLTLPDITDKVDKLYGIDRNMP